MENEKNHKKITLVTISQSIFLSVKFFLQNRLLSYAGACSFSFLFSFIPVFMLIVVVLVQILHASPDVVESIVQTIPELSKYCSTEEVIEGIKSMEELRAFGIIIGLFIFWMARRFFASVSDSFQNIFHTQIKRKALSNQMFTLAIEAIIVMVVAVVTFIYISLRAIMDTPTITNFLRKIPQLSFFFNGLILSNVIKYFPNILILIIVSVIYKTAPGTKPSKRLYFGSSLLCTFTFLIFRMMMHSFLNIANYNLIYGVLGQVIITLMDIYFFFTFFLFFAQFMFVYQFFNELLLGELYLLPKREEVGLLGAAKLLLFIRPDYLMAEDAKVVNLKKGESLYDENDNHNCAYYVVNGTIVEKRSDGDNFFTQGDFFGEIGCIIRKRRNSKIIAECESKVIRIDPDVFEVLSKKNPQIMKKLLGKISSSLYFID